MGVSGQHHALMMMMMIIIIIIIIIKGVINFSLKGAEATSTGTWGCTLPHLIWAWHW
jgi:hypothetical protein